ncbi:MAG TPA: glucosamine-fructose-6-phosphate aminotransferase, partial [Longimicrobiales bacterium]
KARGGRVIAVTTDGNNDDIADLVDHLIPIPRTLELLTPILATIPLQLLAYHVAVMRGCNVDMPRNLAKSVTVE